jgi:hypothetical protein
LALAGDAALDPVADRLAADTEQACQLGTREVKDGPDALERRLLDVEVAAQSKRNRKENAGRG